MEFKYLPGSIFLDGARRAYHSPTRQLHLDIGRDEDEFKTPAHEYSVIECRASENIIANISNIMEAAGVVVGVVVQTSRGFYPWTRMALNYTSSIVEAKLCGNAPVERMVTIEQVTNSLGYSFSVIVLFKRDVREIAITSFTKSNVTWTDIPQEVGVDVKEMPIYSGRRCTIHHGSKYGQCKDRRNPHPYVMWRTLKYSLWELLRISK